MACSTGEAPIPETMPEDFGPDNIREPQNDNAGTGMTGSANGTEVWLRRIGIIE